MMVWLRGGLRVMSASPLRASVMPMTEAVTRGGTRRATIRSTGASVNGPAGVQGQDCPGPTWPWMAQATRPEVTSPSHQAATGRNMLSTTDAEVSSDSPSTAEPNTP